MNLPQGQGELEDWLVPKEVSMYAKNKKGLSLTKFCAVFVKPLKHSEDDLVVLR